MRPQLQQKKVQTVAKAVLYFNGGIEEMELYD